MPDKKFATSRLRTISARAQRERRRDELLHVAATVFAERGYGGASMRDIAERWGVQAAALYYYFPSKAMLLEGICRFGITHFLDRLGEIHASDLPTDEKLREAVRAHIEPLIQNRFYVHAFLYLRRELPRAMRRPLDAKAHAYEALWREILREGQARKVIPRSLDTRIAVLAILGMCNSVARWSGAGAGLGLDPVARAFTDLIAFGVFGQAATARRGKRAQTTVNP
ncbi:MAG: TetR/AcrR family transcriptional regulator [Burkholderiales bacterium]